MSEPLDLGRPPDDGHDLVGGRDWDPSDPFGTFASELPDPASPLTATGHLRRRQAISRMVEACHTASALVAVGVLAIVVYSVASRGASALSVEFFTKGPPLILETPGGGIAPEIVGTAVLMALATLIALPVGVLIALYLTEFAGQRVAYTVRLALDLLNGLPTIVIGLFIFGLLVVGKYQSGFAGAMALSIIMLPLIARASQEALLRVPRGLREAADALGVSRWRTVRGVVLPSARGGILTASVLAVARASGETAPLLLTCSIFGNAVSLRIFGQAIPNIPVYIFSASEAADPYGFARAWGAGLVLLLFILVSSLGARMLLANRGSADMSRG